MLLCLFLLLFSLPNFDFTFFTFWYCINYLGNLNWEVQLLTKFRKLHSPPILWLICNSLVVVCYHWPVYWFKIYNQVVTMKLQEVFLKGFYVCLSSLLMYQSKVFQWLWTMKGGRFGSSKVSRGVHIFLGINQGIVKWCWKSSCYCCYKLINWSRMIKVVIRWSRLFEKPVPKN